MTQTVAVGSTVRVPSAVAVGSRFDRYKPEEEKVVRKVEVKEDAVLRQLKAAWKKFDYAHDPETGLTDNYRKADTEVKRIRYSAKDVENFSLAMVEFQDEEGFSRKAGYFLSALVNNCKDTDYVIHTQHLSQKIDCVGYRNTKNIIVNGNVNTIFGYEMSGGSITVNGNAGVDAGQRLLGGAIAINGNVDGSLGLGMEHGSITVNGDAKDYGGQLMNGGTIIVNGNVGDNIGFNMAGGTIIVNGNAGNVVGDLMRRGEIHIEGDYGGLSKRIKGGKIYHKGKLIVDR